MTTPTLAEIIRDAMTNPTSPVQAAGIPHDPEQYEIFDDVAIPLPVQHLHNICCGLADEANALVEQGRKAEMSGNREMVRTISKQLQPVHERHEILSSLRWALFEEAFPAKRSKYKSMSIMEGWKMAGEIRTEGDEMGGLGDMLAKALAQHMGDRGVEVIPGDGDEILAALMGGQRR